MKLAYMEKVLNYNISYIKLMFWKQLDEYKVLKIMMTLMYLKIFIVQNAWLHE